MKRMSVLVFASAALTTGLALAHTELSSTTPANGAMIAEAPKNLTLTFSEPVRLTALSIRKDDERTQSLGPLPAETRADFAVALPTEIADGHYVVSWRAMSEDTHVMTGEFMFAVGAAGTHDAHMNHADMPADGHHAMPAEQHENHSGAH